MRSIGLLLTLLRLSAAAAAGAEDVEWATYVPGGALAEPTDIRATSTGGITKRRVPSVNVDGTKGTHYGDPSEGCMKDEVSLDCRLVTQLPAS